MNPPKNDGKYEWTRHAWEKMRYYGISESRVKRIVRFPERTEEGIAENTIAAMQRAGAKNQQEIWVMYKLSGNSRRVSSNFEFRILKQPKKAEIQRPERIQNFKLPDKIMKIITAWRYPGVSPKRNPIPEEILAEINEIL
ncbi:hypothetical protein A3I34_02815 [Candidatus Jorgensenbacteria bacterium RIFCSPLOWO2_02_FULL_45_12]|uniref:Uncharacterized protein n=1 Tax=Candidatus Jorgensenbacteria bacterium RIFCSPHIGHO2_02_FULL_45_20 TaxID=1798470 RepID=A0A1F6BQB8_9BACT|nr:MAG: hypothetical protein A3D55_00205 [Candidatus Jorgensenbacteria bacterium RIFCSPHIGHO2_02_FULL_45_20]OGG42283.1 MAG: hypothetical protein A3I34_02815 [Candidatus Jorgensenbacteria bacterium RIFCSPLOWO2_02_FULL_45_12]